jgi:hypothetical protein
MRKTLRPDNRARRPLAIRMERNRSYLMDECAVMAPARERPPTSVIPNLVRSSCNQKNLGARKSELG